MKYYEKILTSKPLAADYLNAGHVAWRTGKIEKAAELYSKAALEYGVQEWIGFIGVENISGSYYNIMGLPVQRLYRELLEI